MQDDREWVQVEVTWDEDLADAGDEIAWDQTPWEDQPLFDPRPQPIYPAMPPHFAPAARGIAPAPRQPDMIGGRRDERSRPKRQKPGTHLTKRKRKKLRAWDIEDEE